MGATKGGAKTGGKTSAARVAVADKQVRALELRRSGKTYDAIAVELGYASPTGAKKAVETALERTLQEPAAEVRKLELDRLDRLMRPWWEMATAVPPDREAAEIVLKFMARRAKLLGIDAPKSLELLGKDGATLVPQIVINMPAEKADAPAEHP